MNELQLSNDLPQIEFEISHYQQQGAEAIFEIGKRLKHVKENNLQYGEFGKWLDEIGIDHTFAKRSMKISSELNIDSAHVHQLGIRALTQIVSLPEEHREEKQQTSSGEMKTPYEMTNKEREEFKRQLKQREEEKSQLESQLAQAQRSESIARKQLEAAEDREPEVVEKYMEPEDYQQTKEALAQSRHHQKLIEQRNDKLEKEIKEMEQQRDEITEKSQKYDELNKAINHMNAKLTDGQQKLKAQKEVHEYVKKANELIREVAPMSYFVHNEFILNNEYAKKPIEKVADDLLDISNKIKKRLNQGDVIDV
ncbi:pathogenicity island protein [Staphylococcus phage vB_SarS_BM31]|nr:pathogenicity island protein [Staphylococcus phage vB_SarS_BM31]